MRKICTVLLLNFLRSTKHPKALLISSISLVILLAVFAAHQWGPSAATVATQQANAVVSNAANSRAANAAPAANAPAKQANPKKADTNKAKANNNSSQASPSRSSSDATRTADLTVKNISLDPTNTVCNGQQPAYAVQAAHIGVATSMHGAGAIRWRWETRVDGSDATDSPPISDQVYSQSVTAGSLPVVFQNDDQSPLLTAPTSSTYSYSFRLHILSPNDITSDWVSVPVVLDNSCQQPS